jgi:hypothetical protein
MRQALLGIAVMLGLTACGGGADPAPKKKVAAVDSRWYKQAVDDLVMLTGEANQLFAKGRKDDAADLIQKAEPLASRVLGVPRPTLQATQAASDLDDLYGRMLLSNKRYGWARLQFQKNLARWRHWEPQTEDTAKRLAQAKAAIAECDKHIE